MKIISNPFARAFRHLPPKYTISTLQSIDIADNQDSYGCIWKFSYDYSSQGFQSQGSDSGSLTGADVAFFFFFDVFRSFFFLWLLFFAESFLTESSGFSCAADEDGTEEDSGGGVATPGAVPPQLRTMNPDDMHKRAAAATATSPLLSFDVSGCFIRYALLLITLHCGWRACARSRQGLSCADEDGWV